MNRKKTLQTSLPILSLLMAYHQGWGKHWTYEYDYWKISPPVVLKYNVFSIFMFIILGKTSTGVVLASALPTTFWC